MRRAVARARQDTQDQVRDDVRAQTGTWVRVHPENPAMTTMTVTGPTELVLGLEATLDATARGLSAEELAGRTLGMARSTCSPTPSTARAARAQAQAERCDVSSAWC